MCGGPVVLEGDGMGGCLFRGWVGPPREGEQPLRELIMFLCNNAGFNTVFSFYIHLSDFHPVSQYEPPSTVACTVDTDEFACASF